MSAIACSLLMAAQVSTPHPWMWKALPHVTRLIDRIDAPGVVAVTADGKAYVLNADGTEKARVVLGKDSQPILYGHAGLIDGPKIPPIYPEAANSSPSLFLSFGAQQRNVICISAGVTVHTPYSVFSDARFDNWSAIAVAPDGHEITIIERPMDAPLLNRYKFDGDQWVPTGSTITPEVDKVGFACPLQGFADMRYVADQLLVFEGGVWPEKGIQADSMKTLEEDLKLNSTPLELEDVGARPGYLYLFMVSVHSRVTIPVAKLVASNLGEGRSGPLGKLSVSSDGHWLYLLCKQGVARVAVSKLISMFTG